MSGQCLMVRFDNSGNYAYLPDAEREDWDEVQALSAHVDWLEPLVGWSIWEDVYRCVSEDGEHRFYFVCEDPVDDDDRSYGAQQQQKGL